MVSSVLAIVTALGGNKLYFSTKARIASWPLAATPDCSAKLLQCNAAEQDFVAENSGRQLNCPFVPGALTTFYYYTCCNGMWWKVRASDCVSEAAKLVNFGFGNTLYTTLKVQATHRLHSMYDIGDGPGLPILVDDFRHAIGVST